MRVPNLTLDDDALRAGLDVHVSGGDFADGMMASVGRAMGGETFVSFDRKAIARLQALGVPAQLASSLT
jgi:predicted nucleic-acid-binding protein